ncbi:DUF1499 domain-containing protein [uncultured Roseibium sp.]|uniref:DUF1499 domain-containing protein n=1 Tax=uncultured Roseibium sp. TaxID=1936171 RepID=UPI003217587B
MKRYPVYSSTSARVSQRLGAVAVPVSILAVLAQRVALIGPREMVFSVLAGAGLGIVAILFALVAFTRLWVRGGTGAAKAVLGTLYGLVALVPLGLFAGQAILSPGMGDVSTNWSDPPQFKTVSSEAGEDPGDVLKALFQPSETGLQRDLFPDIVPRRYRIAPAQLHAAALEVARRNGWVITYELPPDLLDAPTGLQVEARTPLLGLVEDMVVRIRPDPVGVLLDVRSVSRFGLEGLTGNADRIRALFAGIDDVLLETYGDLARVSVTEEDLATPDQAASEADAEGPVEVDTGRADAERIPIPAFKPYFGEEDNRAPDEDNTAAGLSG